MIISILIYPEILLKILWSCINPALFYLFRTVLMRIWLDMDEVLCNLISPLAEKFGVDFQQITNYHLWEIMNISKQEAIEAAIDMIKEDFEKNHTILTPTEYSSEVVASLRSGAIKMFVITSRPSLVEKFTLSWLEYYFPKMFDEVIFTNKTMDLQLWNKENFLKQLDLDIFVDDNVENCLWAIKTGVKKVFLLDKPWNQGSTDTVKRIKTMKEILHLI